MQTDKSSENMSEPKSIQDVSKDLWVAAKTGNIDHVVHACNSGADINAQFGVDLGTPLQRASKKGFTEIVKALLTRGVNVDLRNKYGNTATHFASRLGHVEIIQCLTENGADLDAQDNNGSSAYHFAADEGRHQSIIELAKHNANINLQNRWGDTAGHWGAHQGHVKVIQELLKHGLDAKILNKEGKTALMKAKAKISYWAMKGETDKYEQYMKVVSLLQAAEQGNPMPDISNDVPEEIFALGEDSVKVFKDSLENGTENSYIMKFMVVGHTGAGKTTLTKNLLFREQVVNSKIFSTSGIGIYPWRCRYDRETKEWIILPQGTTQHDIYEKLADIITQSMRSKKSDPPKKSDNVEPSFPSVSVADDDSTLRNPETTDVTEPKRQKLQEIKKTETDTETKEVIPIIEKTLQKLKEGSLRDRYVAVTLWDFAGHSIFYTTHQTFMSPRCIYLLVFDASMRLKDHVEDDRHLNPNRQTTSSVIEFISFWVNSITTYAIGLEKGHPKIVLIGTHKDIIPQEKVEETRTHLFNEIEKYFEDHPAKEHLIIDHKLLLNAKDAHTPESKYLRQLLGKIAEKQPTWGEKLPAKWIPLEEAITDRKLSMTDTIISVNELKKMNNANQMISMPEKELKVFLQFHHSIGNILYFPEHSLRDFIILDPKLLVEALQTFITDESLLEPPEVQHLTPEILKTGIIHEHQIDQLWQHERFRHFLSHRTHLLQVMERLDLIAKPRNYGKDTETSKENDYSYYLVPCLLKPLQCQSEPDSVAASQNDVTLSITFKNNFLPPALYHRLVACCISVWAYKQLSSGFCSFQLDPFHTMTLVKREFRIYVHISHTLGRRSLSKLIWSGTQRFLIHSLNQLISSYHQSVVKAKREITEEPFYIEVPCCFHEQATLIRQENTSITCSHVSGSEEVPSDFLVEKARDQNDLETDVAPEDIPMELILDFISSLLSFFDITPFTLALHLDLDMKFFDDLRHNHSSKREEFFAVLWNWKCTKPHISPIMALLQQLHQSESANFHGIFSQIEKFSKRNYFVDDVPGPDVPLTYDDCRIVAKHVGKRYLSLGRYLGVPQTTLDQIEIDYIGDVKERTYRILETSIQTRQNWTRQDLCSGLKYIGQGDMITQNLAPVWI